MVVVCAVAKPTLCELIQAGPVSGHNAATLNESSVNGLVSTPFRLQ